MVAFYPSDLDNNTEIVAKNKHLDVDDQLYKAGYSVLGIDRVDGSQVVDSDLADGTVIVGQGTEYTEPEAGTGAAGDQTDFAVGNNLLAGVW